MFVCILILNVMSNEHTIYKYSHVQIIELYVYNIISKKYIYV